MKFSRLSFCFLTFFIGINSFASEPIVIGHRGAAWYAPEESIESYLLALEMGVDYLETDATLSKDGVLVLNHDDTFERTSNIASIPELSARAKDPVKTFTWEEIRKLEIGSFYNHQDLNKALSVHHNRASFVGTPVLRLEDLLTIAQSHPKNKPGVYIEAKYPKGDDDRASLVAEKIVETLKANGWITPEGNLAEGSKVILQSFSPQAVQTFKRLAPGVPAMLLSIIITKHSQFTTLVSEAQRVGADIIGPFLLPYQYRPYLEEAHKAGLKVHVWVVDDIVIHGFLKLPTGQPAMAALKNAGVDGIFSDQPDLAKNLFATPSVKGGMDIEPLFIQANGKKNKLLPGILGGDLSQARFSNH